MTPLQLIDRSRQGLAGTEADWIAQLLRVSDKEMAPLLNQSVATFHRQTKTERLDAATSERLLLLGCVGPVWSDRLLGPRKIYSLATLALRLLGDRSPLALMDSPTGVQLVENILGRIGYGVFG